MKKIITLVISLIIFFGLYSIELNNNEKEWLKDRKVFKILISNNNAPYEYINEKNEAEGINIDIYKRIFNRLNKKVVFVSEDDYSYDIDCISSLSRTDRNKEISTSTPFKIKYYIISIDKDFDLKSINRVYMINQDILFNTFPELSTKSLFIYSDILSAYHSFIKDKSAILIVDNLRLSQIDKFFSHSENIIYTHKVDKEIESFLWLKNEDKILYNIISKLINEMLIHNEITEIITQWENTINDKVLFYHYYKRILTIFSVFLVLFVFVVVLIFKFKVLKKGLINSVYQTINRNKELMIENQDLSFSIREMEKQSINVLDSINNIAITMDLKGNIKYINNSVLNILGYTPQSLIGTNIGDIISYEDKMKLLSINQETYAKTKNEIIIQSIEGFQKTFIYTTNFSKEVKGQSSINCILQDITERIELNNRLEAYTNHLEDLVRQRTQVLKQSEERFRFIVEHAFDGIFLMQNYMIQLANLSFYQTTGLNKDNISDNNFSFINLIPEDDRINFIKQFQQRKEDNEDSFIIVHRILINPNKSIEVETHFTSINYNDKILDLGMMHDIEEKKDRERELIEHEKFLTVSSFAVTANDKINSPLNAILGYTELLDLQIKEKTVTQEKAFNNIYLSISIIQKILNRLRSITDVTMKSYNLEDLKMLTIDEENYSEDDGGNNE